MSNGERGTIGLIHGSGHQAVHWDLLRPELEQRGYNTIAVDLPATRADATYQDYAETAAAAFAPAIKDGQKLKIFAHSGGSQTVPGLVKLLGEESIGAIIHGSGSLGADSGNDHHGVRDPMDLWRPRIPSQRNTTEFQGAIRRGPDGLITFDPAQIRRLFFHDCPPEVFIWALENMQSQARPKDEPPLEAHRQPHIPQWYLLPNEDRIRNHEWAVRAAGSLGMTIVDMPGGHSPAISRPAELATLIATLLDRIPDEQDTIELHLPLSRGNP